MCPSSSSELLAARRSTPIQTQRPLAILPDPTSGDYSAPVGYLDGIAPSHTLWRRFCRILSIKAIGEQAGHPNSAIVSALFPICRRQSKHWRQQRRPVHRHQFYQRGADVLYHGWFRSQSNKCRRQRADFQRPDLVAAVSAAIPISCSRFAASRPITMPSSTVSQLFLGCQLCAKHHQLWFCLRSWFVAIMLLLRDNPFLCRLALSFCPRAAHLWPAVQRDTHQSWQQCR